MSISSTIAAIKALPGMTARWSSEYREFRVTYAGWPADRAEAVSAYETDTDSALATAHAMAAHLARNPVDQGAIA